jgi:hypothetical protein
MRLYLDNCCFNRPFDDQGQLRVRLETEAKLRVQEEIRGGRFDLVWSYILDYENSKNPMRERREQIDLWHRYATVDVIETPQLIKTALRFEKNGLKTLDALHLACALSAAADCFLTTDDGILKKCRQVEPLRVMDPLTFVREVSL